MTLRFSVAEAGQYAVWARIVAWDAHSDSFWVKIEGVDPDEDPQKTQNTHFRWTMSPRGTVWAWDRVNSWVDIPEDIKTDRVWDLPAGDHRITFAAREDAAMIDSVFITNNLSSDAGEVELRAPTPSDVDLQMGAAADVDAVGKTASVWGRLKQ